MEESEIITIPYIKIFSDELEALDPFSDEEVGRLFRGMLRYMNGLDPALEGNERFAWGMVKTRLNAQKKAYEKKVESVTNARTARADTRQIINKSEINMESDSNQSEINMESDSNQSEISMESGQEKRREEKRRKEKTREEPKKTYGEFGWVKMSDSDYNDLIADYGPEEVNRSIKYVDELAESTGNSRKWKNWRLIVLRSCRDGWGKGTYKKEIRTASEKNYSDTPRGWVEL